MQSTRRTVISSLALAVAMTGFGASALGASGRPPVSLEERIDGAQSVVVARTERVDSMWQQNADGDRIIVSRVLLRIEETLKGAPALTTWMEVEGGTVNGMTLHVSDMPDLTEGERGVFMLDAGASGLARPHLRGQGILKLDDDDTVSGTPVHLSQVRQVAARRNEN
jgi:hypothetical protein